MAFVPVERSNMVCVPVERSNRACVPVGKALLLQTCISVTIVVYVFCGFLCSSCKCYRSYII